RRSSTEKKPTIRAIETTESCFNFTRLTSSQNGLPKIDKYFQVVRVKGSGPAPITRLFGGEAGIVKPALIEEVSRAVRTSGPGKRGDRVNHQPNVRCRQSLFGGVSWGSHRLKYR